MNLNFFRLFMVLFTAWWMLTSAHAACPSVVNRFAVNGSEVTDRQTGLVWARCSVGLSWNGTTCVGAFAFLTHEAALATAQAQTGWRLPNIKELVSLTDDGCADPALDASVFPNGMNRYYWSSSPSTIGSAWAVSFGYGGVDALLRSYGSVAVRLVRIGQ